MKQAVQPNQIRLIVLLLFILIIASSRVLLAANDVTPLSNFSAIGAMALFGGAYFGRIKAFCLSSACPLDWRYLPQQAISW